MRIKTGAADASAFEQRRDGERVVRRLQQRLGESVEQALAGVFRRGLLIRPNNI
jgi:hypothetical protein